MPNTNTAVPTFEQIQQFSRSFTRNLGRQLRGEDDWPLLLFLASDAGIGIAPLWEYPVETEEEKDHLARVVIPILVHTSGARRACLVSPAWVLPDQSDGGYRDYVTTGNRISDHPDRIEVIVQIVVDPTRCEVAKATVNRRGHLRPKLGAWDSFRISGADGRFVTPLRRALCPQG